jgi:hypothetical protein
MAETRPQPQEEPARMPRRRSVEIGQAKRIERTGGRPPLDKAARIGHLRQESLASKQLSQQAGGCGVETVTCADAQDPATGGDRLIRRRRSRLEGLRQIVGDGVDQSREVSGARRLQHVALPVLLGKQQCRQDDALQDFVQRAFLEQVLGQFLGFVWIAREQPPVELNLGASSGWSPSRTSKNCSCGTCRPSTTMQTVRGVASSNPTGPQRVVQNTAATVIASGERPVLEP